MFDEHAFGSEQACPFATGLKHALATQRLVAHIEGEVQGAPTGSDELPTQAFW
jgi:hypothetical protein